MVWQCSPHIVEKRSKVWVLFESVGLNYYLPYTFSPTLDPTYYLSSPLLIVIAIHLSLLQSVFISSPHLYSSPPSLITSSPLLIDSRGSIRIIRSRRCFDIRRQWCIYFVRNSIRISSLSWRKKNSRDLERKQSLLIPLISAWIRLNINLYTFPVVILRQLTIFFFRTVFVNSASFLLNFCIFAVF